MTLRDATTMSCFFFTIRSLLQYAGMLRTLIVDATDFLLLCLRPQAALAAENLFLCKQLALYQESHVTPRRASNTTRITLVWLSQWFDWPSALAVVQLATFQRWRRKRWHLWWRSISCPGRPPIPAELQGLIRQMAYENLTWGQRRIANELQLKLGLRVSPRTVHKYTPKHLHPAPGQRATPQRWRTFVHNHAWDLIARGMASDLTRGLQTLAARMKWLLQRCRRPTVASGWRGTSPRDATYLSPLSAPSLGLAAWSRTIVEVIGVDQRSPPDFGPSCPHDPGLATQATSVDRFDVCPAGAALCWWNRAHPHTRGARPLSKSGSQVLLRRRAA
jgi:hypothetical protein